MRRALTLTALALVGFSASYLLTARGRQALTHGAGRAAAPSAPASAAPAGMAWVPGGEFLMGSDGPEANASERPAHRVRVDGFWMDAAEVTNAEFGRFVAATGYRTTAERPVDWEQLKRQLPPGTPEPPADRLAPGSLAFTPPGGPVPLDDAGRWWSWVPGADWRHPEGPGSSIEGREDHPVVSVSWDDAAAFAAWGDEFRPGGRLLANTWQGRFPAQNTREDGFLRTAPVRSFPPNGYGLHDMVGNVWEWCADWYRPDAYVLLAEAGGVAANPTGPETSLHPAAPLEPRRVTRGGSYLCSEGYCSNYRPAARRGTAADSGMAHLGFRCVKSAGRPHPRVASRG